MTNEPIGVTVRFPRSLYKKLLALAQAEGRSINQQAIKLIEESLNQQDVLQGLDQRVQENRDKIDQMLRLIPDLRAQISRLQAQMEGKPRRRRDQDQGRARVNDQA
jgi:hypothetical protein